MKRSKFGRTPKTAVIVGVAVALMITGTLSANALKSNSVKRAAAKQAAAKPGVGPQPPFTADFFGISTGADLTTQAENQFDNQMNRMKAVGVRWVRAAIPWSLVYHDNPDDANWVMVDRMVNMVEAEGMKMDGIIDSPPKWAKSNVTPVPDCVDQPPFDLPAYADFAAQVAARYGSARIAALELENAPNLPGIWKKAMPCPYTRLMQAAYPAIKAVDPAITVLTAGLGAQKNDGIGQPGDVFFQNMYTYGAHGYFDVLSWHPYSYPCFPSASCAKLRPWYRTDTVRQAMVDNGDAGKQIWATEFGAPTNGTPTDGHVDENNQAAMMVDGMKHWVQYPWAGPMFVFEFRDFGAAPTNKSDWFGLTSRTGKYKKLSFYTYQYEATGSTTVTLPPNVLAGVPHA